MSTYTLLVRIIEARDLRAADKGGTSDPYVKVRVGSMQSKTKVVKKCLNPKWGESFRFKIANPKTAKVILDVKDKDKWSSDDPLGTVSLSLIKLEQGVESDEWHTLTGTTRGQIRVGLTAEDFGLPRGSSQMNQTTGYSAAGGAYPSQGGGAYPPQGAQSAGGAYPSQSGGAYPSQGGGAYPPQNTGMGGYPPAPQPGGYPPAPQPHGGAYPSQSAAAGYPPASQPPVGGYPPAPQPGGGSYQSGGAGYPPSQPQVGGYPPQPQGVGAYPPAPQPQAQGLYATSSGASSSLYSSFQNPQTQPGAYPPPGGAPSSSLYSSGAQTNW